MKRVTLSFLVVFFLVSLLYLLHLSRAAEEKFPPGRSP